MKDISSYSDLLDIAFKFIGLLVALYIAPIKKSISSMSDEMRGMQNSVNELNKNMAIIFEKHDAKEKQLDVLQSDMKSVRNRLHELGNKATKMDLNEIRIEKLEGKK